MSKRILSCMQPSGGLTLGNYLGALKNWVNLQNQDCQICLYGIVDQHSITIPYNHDELKMRTLEIAAAYIAGGIDVKKSTLFVQSAVPAHTKLNWLLSSMTQMGKLNRMTQFKDKAGKDKEKAGLGLYAYPVLMAADILIYKATHVPVGDDQKQHLELARDIAATFNHRYDVDFFPMPETISAGAATRVMSLRNGNEKMSKSAESDMTRINLDDDADTIALKIKKAKTDPEPLPDTLEALGERAEARNLINIYAALSDQPAEIVIASFAGKQFSEFKPALSELAIEKLAPITEEIIKLMDQQDELDKILRMGSEKANAIAEPIYTEISDIMGFWR